LRIGVLAVLVSILAVAAAAIFGGLARHRGASAPPDLVFGDAFWKRWGDGQAEIAAYDLTFPRYGEPRPGVAIAIFVTETFSDAERVKADPGRHPKSDEIPVMKLNLVEDFATGIYDYNLMTSTFVALVPFHGRPAGSPVKVSFSSQEWCGNAYQQILLDDRTLRSTSHSYFDGEADRAETAVYPEGAVLEDALFHWARGLAAPRLAPGESRDVALLRSTSLVRLRHLPLVWEEARLARGPSTSKMAVPAGEFDVDTYTAEVRGDAARRWTFSVEAAEPHRLVRFERDDGLRADLVRAERMAYWRMNGAKFVPELERLGLRPRPPRTP
jgi:hypothetical protein